MKETDFKNAFELISDTSRVAIVGHIRPDGDCVGSALAMKMAIENMGKTAEVFIDGEMPNQFFYLDGVDTIKNTMPTHDSSQSVTNFDLLIVLDSSSEDRIGIFTNLRAISKKVLCIDHHIGTAVEADTVISVPERASCGELLYEFFTKKKIKITPEIATALYTAVSTDTGCFLYANTTAYTHRVAADLIEIGADMESINYYNFRVYERRLIAGFRQVMRNLRFCNGGQISYTRIKMRKNKKYHFDFEERHKFKQFASDAKGVSASIFLTQEERNTYHVSLRSHGDINVAIPAQTFGGGGHKNAAGFTIRGKYRTIVKKIIRELEKQLPHETI